MTDEFQPLAAWRCEQCYNWRPAAEPATALLVNEVGQSYYDHTQHVVRFRREKRVVVVCEACKETMTGETA